MQHHDLTAKPLLAGRNRPRDTLRASIRAAAVWTMVACTGQAAPTRHPATADAASDAAATADSVACPASRQLAAGTCCASGTAAVGGSTTCATVGPPECSGELLAKPEGCVPRWCATWQNEQGLPCAASATALCLPVARTCTDAELLAAKGCAAGDAPDPAGGCHPAGRAALPGQSGVAVNALGEPVQLPAASTPAMPRWCPTAAGEVGDCAAGQIGCAVGEIQAAGGSCTAITGPTWTCPAGFAAGLPAVLPELPTCIAATEACGAGPYGKAGGASHFVDAAAATPGAGTLEQPWSSLAVALANSPTGAVIAVAAGTYVGNFAVPRALQVRGRCAAKVIVQAGDAGQPALTVAGAWSVKLTGVAVHGGLAASSGAKLDLANVAAVAGAVAALAASGTGTHIEASNTWFTANDYAGQDGESVPCVKVSAGAHASLLGSRASRCWGNNVFIEGSGSELQLTDCVVDSGRPVPPNLTNGRGVLADAGSKLTIKHSRIHHNRAVGIWVSAAASAELSDVAITDTQPRQSDGVGGGALRVDENGQALVRHVAMTGNHTTGISASDSASLNGRNVLVAQLKDANGTSLINAAFRWTDKSSGELRYVAARQLVGHGVLANGPVALVVDHAVLIELRRNAASRASGLHMREGAQLTVSDLRLFRVESGFVEVWDAGSVLRLRDAWLADDGPAGDDRIGTHCGDGGRMEFERLRISGATRIGLSVENASSAAGHDLVVDALLAASDDAGYGVQALSGGSVVAHRILIRDAYRFGIAAFDGGQLTVTDVAIADLHETTIPAEPPLAAAFALGDSQVAACGVRLTRIRQHGALARGDAAQLSIHGLAYDQHRDGKGFGAGAVAFDGAYLQLHGSYLRGAAEGCAAVVRGGADIDRVVCTGSPTGPGATEARRWEPNFDDGFILSDCWHPRLRRSVAHGKARSGLLLSGGVGASIGNNAIFGNLYGAVVQLGAALESVSDAVFGNQIANVARDTGLSVPTPPKFAAP